MRNTSNHFDGSLNTNYDDNQFLLVPSRLNETSNKDEQIKKLQLRNQKLLTQIQKVEKILSEPQQKTIYGIKLPELKNKATQQQLQNAYKQIKTYEYEINKLKTVTKDGSYVEQVKKCESLFKQKQEITQKLRRDLAQLKKSSNEVIKQLKNDSRKQELQNKTAKLSSQIKWLREKLKELENKQNMKTQNSAKQLSFIKKLQNQLIKSGFARGSLRELQQKYAPSEDNPNSSYYLETSRKTFQKNTRYAKSVLQQQHKQKQYVQDRTPQAFTSLLNEIKILQKLDKDYSTQLALMEKQRDEAAKINNTTRNRLLQVEDQTERVQKRIQQLKKMIDPSKVKPTRGLSLSNTTRYGDSARSMKVSFKHLYKNQQIGKISKQGSKIFADRSKLGKNQSKIVAVDVYENKQTRTFVGFQATYQINKTIKKGPVNMIEDSKNCNKKSLVLFDNQDYIKGIQCVCNQRTFIVGIGFYSAKGVSLRAGVSDGFRRALNIGKDEYPVALYVSFTENGIQLFGTQILEEKKK